MLRHPVIDEGAMMTMRPSESNILRVGLKSCFSLRHDGTVDLVVAVGVMYIDGRGMTKAT